MSWPVHLEKFSKNLSSWSFLIRPVLSILSLPSFFRVFIIFLVFFSLSKKLFSSFVQNKFIFSKFFEFFVSVSCNCEACDGMLDSLTCFG